MSNPENNRDGNAAPSISLNTSFVDRNNFFTYTSGRWLWDEEYQLKQRSIRFDVQALAAAAAQSVVADSCVEVSKLGEGNFNKTFLLKMDNDVEVVARIPHPNAGPPHLTTASEVATLSFLRNHLKINVPKVFSWSSNASSTPVGAEYILMERANGVELNSRWETLSDADRTRFLKEYFPVEKKLAEIKFPKYGCLYFKDDLPNISESDVIFDQYVVGPTTSLAFWSETSDIDIDRGPCKSPHQSQS